MGYLVIMSNSNTASAVTFRKHFVTNGAHKARVWYGLDNHVSFKPCVTVYGKTCLEKLMPIFGADTQNDSDSHCDYFENDRVRLFEGHPLYAALRAHVKKLQA